MRKLIYSINTTLDGCVDHAKNFVDDELLDYYTQLVRETGLFVYGRKTYELMVPYWPDILKRPSQTKADTEFATAFVATPKAVFSRTLNSVDDGNTRLVRGELADEILKLKQEKGKEILVGGVDLPSQLTALGLIDEYHIVVGPVVAGKGRRLWDSLDLPQRLSLKLVDSRVLKSGCVALRYSKQ